MGTSRAARDHTRDSPATEDRAGRGGPVEAGRIERPEEAERVARTPRNLRPAMTRTGAVGCAS